MTDSNLRMLDLARFYLGVAESGGDNRGPIVERFQKAVDGKAEGEPWCMAFLQFLALETQGVHGGDILVPKTESCLNCFNGAPGTARITLSNPGWPPPGAWIVWRHGDSIQGHAEIVDSWGQNFIRTIGGNTGPGAGIVREGDGVYLRERPWDPIAGRSDQGDMRMVGILRVFQ